MKLGEIYTEWLAAKRRQVKLTTLNVYLSYWICRVQDRWHYTELADINRHTVRAWVYELLDSGLSQKYIKGMLMMLKNILNYAHEELELDIQSTDWKIVWPTKNKEGAKRIETYSADDVRKVITACQQELTPRTIALMIAFCSGMRIGEICGLKWSDVDLDNKVFHVNRTVIRTSTEDDFYKTFVHVGSTKTTSGTRDIPIVSTLIPTLRQWKKFHGENKYVASCNTAPVEPNILRNWSYKFMTTAGIKNVLKFHAIRHTFATHLIDAGIDVKSVSSMMGHSDISTTLELYVHPSEESKHKAVNKVSSKFFKSI